MYALSVDHHFRDVFGMQLPRRPPQTYVGRRRRGMPCRPRIIGSEA